MTANLWLPIVVGAVLLLMSVILQRGLHRHDDRLAEAAEKVENAEKIKATKSREHEERLGRIERSLARHTRSLTVLTRGQTALIETDTRHASDLEELEEATARYARAIRDHERRITQSEELIGALRAERGQGE